MRYRNLAGVVLIAIILIVLGYNFNHSQAEDVSRLEKESEITQKLDKVLENQEQILEALEEIKSELAIVKIRASR